MKDSTEALATSCLFEEPCLLDVVPARGSKVTPDFEFYIFKFLNRNNLIRNILTETQLLAMDGTIVSGFGTQFELTTRHSSVNETKA